jgi:hypothetical protein
MKLLMIVSSLALGLAMPAIAQDQKPPAAEQQGSVHAPTNRIDKLVPDMKGPNDNGASGAASGDIEHPPTNRIGKAVPDMKSPNATNDLPSEQPATK